MAIMTKSGADFEAQVETVISDIEKEEIRKFLENRGITQVTEELIIEFLQRNSMLYPRKSLTNNFANSGLDIAIETTIESQPYDFKEQLGIRDQQKNKGDRAMLSTSTAHNSPLIDLLSKNPKL